MMLLNQMVQGGRFDEFIIEFIKIKNEEQQEKTQWDYYIHSLGNVFFVDKFPTFIDFVKANENESATLVNEPVSMNDIEATIKHSYDMANDFVPY